MELEQLKSSWQTESQKSFTETNINTIVELQHKSWFIKNKIALNGILSIAIALFLFVALSRQDININQQQSQLIIYLGWFIISLYTLTKGIWTLLFSLEIRKLDMASSKFLRINLKNQLYFVYEKMTWLWFLIPLIMVIVPFSTTQFIAIKTSYVLIYSLTSALLYLVLLGLFSKALLLKKQKLVSEIEKIELNIL